MLFQRLVQDNRKIWEEYISHPFVNQLCEQSLKQECFLFYLKQDYLYLLQFAKAAARLAINARDAKEIRFALKIAELVLEGEIELHQSFLSQHQFDLRTLSTQEESLTNIAYSRYLLSIGDRGDFVEMLTALSSCVIGYAIIGKKALENLKNLENHLYKEWILCYSSEDFQAFAREYESLINSLAEEVNEEKFKRLSEIFGSTTRLEKAFWQHALDLKMD